MKEANINEAVTIKDIAAKVGVSVATVSRTINNSGKVSKKTAKKVLDAVEELNFVPNEIARELVTKVNNSIGILIPDILNPYYAELIRSIELFASSKGFSVLLYITDSDKRKEEYCINDMIQRRLSGMIMLSTKINDEFVLNKIKRAMKVISIDADIEGVDTIHVDNQGATYRIIKILLEKGHRNIGFIGYQFNLNSIKERLNGYLKALNEHQIPIDMQYVIQGSPMDNPGYDMTNQLLDFETPPTVIHCINDYCALGAYMAICDRDLKIPDDISLTSFDGLLYSKLIMPKLTTGKIPVQEMGAAAAEMLINRILADKIKLHRNIEFPMEIVMGNSVKDLDK